MVARIYGFYLQVVKTIFLKEIKGNYTPPCNFLFTQATYGRPGLGCVSVFLLFLFLGMLQICKITRYFPLAIAKLRAFSHARFCEFFLFEVGLFVAVDI